MRATRLLQAVTSFISDSAESCVVGIYRQELAVHILGQYIGENIRLLLLCNQYI